MVRSDDKDKVRKVPTAPAVNLAVEVKEGAPRQAAVAPTPAPAVVPPPAAVAKPAPTNNYMFLFLVFLAGVFCAYLFGLH